MPKILNPMPEDPTLAASRLASLDACAGFTKQIFERDESAADDGKVIHAAIETGLFPADFTAEQRDMALWCNDLLHFEKGSGDVTQEHQITIPFIQKPGFIDVLITFDDSTATIIDWKTGRNLQDHPEENLQFRAYAVGVWLQNPGLKSIKVIGAYPRMKIKQEAVFTYTDFLATMEKLAEIAVKVKDWPAHLNPNEDCGYCGRASTCPALAKKALNVIQITKGDLPPALDPERIPLHRVDVLAYLLDLATPLGDWIKAVKDRTNHVALKQNMDIPGYRLATRAGTRSFRGGGKEVLSIINATFKELGTEARADAEALLDACKPSVSKVEDIVEANTPPGVTKKKAVETFRAICDQSAALDANEGSTYLKRDGKVQINLLP